MKYSNEFKLQCIEMYYQGKYPETPEWGKDDTFRQQIQIHDKNPKSAMFSFLLYTEAAVS